MANEWNKTAFVNSRPCCGVIWRRGPRRSQPALVSIWTPPVRILRRARRTSSGASESHLAGCAICRRHLIELARLAQTAPSFEAQPAAKPVRIPTRDRLKGAVAGWFDLSTWNLKWQIAGATGGSFAILIVALGAHSLYRASNQTVLVVSESELKLAGRDCCTRINRFQCLLQNLRRQTWPWSPRSRSRINQRRRELCAYARRHGLKRTRK